MIAKKVNSRGFAKRKAGRICVMVLGCHRSGTSAVTRSLNLLGSALPIDVLGPAFDNVTGHWEPSQLVLLNDRMLIEGNSSWHDWRRFNVDVLGGQRLAYYRSEIGDVIKHEYSDHDLFVLKDPRICRFVPLYEEVLVSMGIETRYVLCVRHPLSVVASLMTRDNLGGKLSRLIWLRHVLEAEAATRGRSNCVIIYDQLLKNWRREVSSLDESLGISWPITIKQASSEIDKHFRGDLRHHLASLSQLRSADPLESWLKQVYMAFLNLRLGRSTGFSHSTLDKIRLELNNAESIFGEVGHQEFSSQLSSIEAKSKSHEIEAKVQEIEIKAHVAKLNAQEIEIKALWKLLLAPSQNLKVKQQLLNWQGSISGWLRRNGSDLEIVSNSILFDEDWYLERNPEIVKLDITPANHYCTYGAKDGLPPGPLFDGLWYLSQNPDVAASKINPLVHFMKFGLWEGRSIRTVDGGQLLSSRITRSE